MSPGDEAERSSGQLVPVALDNLTPGCLTVFLFGRRVTRLLSHALSFPSVVLLLAEALPETSTDFTPAFCGRDFYYDTSNQILYVLQSKLDHAGHFVSILLHAMAYVSSGPGKYTYIYIFYPDLPLFTTI